MARIVDTNPLLPGFLFHRKRSSASSSPTQDTKQNWWRATVAFCRAAIKLRKPVKAAIIISLAKSQIANRTPPRRRSSESVQISPQTAAGPSAAAVATTTTMAAAAEQQSAEQFRGQARLPGFAAPRRYDLHLTPDLDACTFAGSVDVAVDVAAPTRFLVLNAADLDVSPADVHFAPQGSDQVPLAACCLAPVKGGWA